MGECSASSPECHTHVWNFETDYRLSGVLHLCDFVTIELSSTPSTRSNLFLGDIQTNPYSLLEVLLIISELLETIRRMTVSMLMM